MGFVENNSILFVDLKGKNLLTTIVKFVFKHPSGVNLTRQVTTYDLIYGEEVKVDGCCKYVKCVYYCTETTEPGSNFREDHKYSVRTIKIECGKKCKEFFVEELT